MSRIGKLPITVPSEAKISLEGNLVTVTGPRGTLFRSFSPAVSIRTEGATVIVERSDNSREARSMQGLVRTLVNNMIVGVTKGFTRELIVTGVGYKVDEAPKGLLLNLGYSHPINFPLPAGIKAKIDRQKQIKVTLEGHDKELLGITAAKIRDLRGPEPYKGKGIQYAEETIVRKAGKAVAKKK